jgi:para-aminobenzoate synthetase / 4-amino-4-deoxychorismate lyase
MLVLEGRPIELDAHLERLAASLQSLYDRPLPSRARDSVSERAAAVEHGKVRLTVAPDPDGRLGTRVATTEVATDEVFPRPERGLTLCSFLAEGGLGSHKWADRALLERAAAAAGPDAVPLLVDADGSALEASRGSLFSAGPGWVKTPPADGRILPGIARRRVLELARRAGVEVSEERLHLDDLRRGEVFLAGSVRGIEPVRSLDGLDLPPAGRVSALIADGLRRRWRPERQGEAAAAAEGGRRDGPRER